ncbi:beta family protein [Rheinheimera nanhaiensis]|uniref:Beta protein n=1 Tax=Rheinheimera nanhaiensis E407-8 TaxID=562729 RepID=I1DY85_9GAMM|nr:beta family protein [Rheinheimera nanhaiensis]GAB59013.1 hypothetical protein RNAN_2003 [Rheinheimera nanhaiensis E407-8]
MKSYTPILKWRQGEYQALFKLDDSIKNKIKPIFVIPPIEYDFEEQRPKKTIQEHIQTVPKRYIAKWRNRTSFIELHESLIDQHMNDGRSVINFIISELNKDGIFATPVVKIQHPKFYLDEIAGLIMGNDAGLAIRVYFNELMNASVNLSLKSIMNAFGKGCEKVDLIIDLGSPENFEPYNIFAKAISTAVKKISDIPYFKSFTIVSHSLNLSTVKPPGGSLIRHEWELYKCLTHELKNIRVPNYSDFTIETPDFISQDMRLLKPAGKVVYTTDRTWEVVKGKQFRGNEVQMISHCKSIANANYYYGKLYSVGDKKIYDTAFNGSSTGTLGTWKDVGINHHITVVVNQLAKTLFGKI